MNKNDLCKKVAAGMLLVTMSLYTAPVFAYSKDETVYSKLNSEGNNYKTIVSTHLTNTDSEDTLNDMTNLTNIKNTNGDEKFSQNGNSLIWDAQKHDIYYQGESESELPISCSVKYELDGEEISAKDIAGKSGNVKVTITYENKSENLVNINGKTQKLYTPFVVVAGTIINNKNNRNIEVSNGKVIDDGTKTIVLGVALPGLQESLNISKDKLDIPNSIEITMDATDFEMGSIMNYVTPKLLEDEDIDAFDGLDELYSQVATLQSSMNQIQDGANTLKEGTDTYTEKMEEFENAMGMIQSGMASANSNYTKINDGIKTLNNSTGTLNNGSKQVADGVSQIETNLNIINEKLGEVLAGTQSLKSGETELITGIDTILTKLNGIDVSDNTEKIAGLEKIVETNNTTIKKLTAVTTTLKQQYEVVEDEATKTQLKTQIESNQSMIQLLTVNTQAQEQTIATLKATDLSAINELKAGLTQVKTGLTKLSAGTDSLTSGVTQIKSGTALLAEKTGELSQGANTIYQGTTKLAQATNTLKDGSSQMKDGLNTLDNSSAQLLQANTQLTEGAQTINDGATTLADGITTFNKEGIQKICNFVNGDLKDLTTRVEKLTDLAKSYNSFTMVEDGVESNSKFVMIIDAVKKQEATSKQEYIVEDNSKEK